MAQTKNRYAPRVINGGRLLSPNRSSRNGARPRIITIHSTESPNRPGSSDLLSVANWLCTTAAKASSNVIVDDEGRSVRLVPDSQKAWTQAWWNPWSLSIEQIGFAHQTEWTRNEIRECARWCALWNKRFNIPLRKAKVNTSTGVILNAGVIRHSELGVRGGNHSDPGKGYPMAEMLALARFYRARI